MAAAQSGCIALALSEWTTATGAVAHTNASPHCYAGYGGSEARQRQIAAPASAALSSSRTVQSQRYVWACRASKSASSTRRVGAASIRAAGASQRSIKALVFDCDGVILESEDLHRVCYNRTFQHFEAKCPGAEENVEWSTEFYDELQNRIGGGKPKMRWYFGQQGWPTSNAFPHAPKDEEEQAALIDTLQDYKTEQYKELIASGQVKPRPGVLELMDEARSQGVLLAVCSAATKSAVVLVLTSLLGQERFERLDCFLAGDDVDRKKPDPTIYRQAAEKLGVLPTECLVVEDSLIGLQAAQGAGMPCIITYTDSTKSQGFAGAAAIYESLSEVNIEKLHKLPELPELVPAS